VGGREVDAQHLDQAREARRLAFRQVEDQAREGGRVDDGVLERTLEAAAHEPGVEGVVAVLDKHRALREAKKRAARVLELGRTDEHRAVDVVALAGVRVDWCAAVDEGVEERERSVEAKAFRADLEDQEGRVARRLDVEGDELRVAQRRLGADLGRVDRDLLPRHELGRAARLEIQRFRLHERASASARRAHAISSNVTARRSSTPTP
jgi:hypothetical protein